MNSHCKLLLLLTFLLLSCDKEKLSKSLDLEEFTVNVPSNWESFALQGFDSKTGGITNGEDELTYDFGWYSYDFKNETTATHFRTSTTIDGKPALIVRPIKKSKGVIGVFIQVDNQNKLSISGRDIVHEDIVIKIFESVNF